MLCYWERYGMTSITQYLYMFSPKLRYRLHLQIGIYHQTYFLTISIIPTMGLVMQYIPLFWPPMQAFPVAPCSFWLLSRCGDLSEKLRRSDYCSKVWWLHNYSFDRSQAFLLITNELHSFIHTLYSCSQALPSFPLLAIQKTGEPGNEATTRRKVSDVNCA